ncbi:MAG: helix-turn-helix transcriptional regulator [Proteobacteria bacterium]|nr:helix-turn-helix transcriptional regulator [Pseudomonadota bacterium]
MNTSKKRKVYNALSEIARLHDQVSFGELIRSIRLCDDVSQVELAKILGISKQHLSAIENGKKAVSSARAAKFAGALGYPVDQFVIAAIEDELRSAGIQIHFDLRKAAGA